MKLAHVRDASATVYKRVLIQGTKDVDGAILKGVDMAASRESNEVFRFTVEGDPAMLSTPEIDPANGVKTDRIIVGRQLAESIGLKTGDIATVISPEGHLTPMGVAPRYREFRVAGLFESGLSEYDATWGYISLEAAQRLGIHRAGRASPRRLQHRCELVRLDDRARQSISVRAAHGHASTSEESDLSRFSRRILG